MGSYKYDTVKLTLHNIYRQYYSIANRVMKVFLVVVVVVACSLTVTADARRLAAQVSRVPSCSVSCSDLPYTVMGLTTLFGNHDHCWKNSQCKMTGVCCRNANDDCRCHIRQATANHQLQLGGK